MSVSKWRATPCKNEDLAASRWRSGNNADSTQVGQMSKIRQKLEYENSENCPIIILPEQFDKFINLRETEMLKFAFEKSH